MRDGTRHHPRGTTHRLAGVVALSLALLTGCAAGDASSEPPPARSAAAAPAPPTPNPAHAVLAASHPTRLRIPAIDVDARGLIDLGLKADKTIEVPADGTTVGWYTASPSPGERGPAVLAAHVDWNHHKGFFYDLHRLKPGDDARY